MPSLFEFATAGQILFGNGTLAEVGIIAARLGKKALVTAGSRGANLERLDAILAASGVAHEHFHIPGEPTVSLVEQGVRAAQDAGCDLVIGFGGGSALDAGKAIAAMLTNPGEPMDYLEVVGRGKQISVQPAPVVAIPTTAGTGSEVTRNAVVAVPEKKVKVSLRSPMMLARAAVVDPQLTASLPPAVTASTGMDALAQVIEPYVSKRANALTDLYCKAGVLRAARSLRVAYENGVDAAAREDMAFASLMGGLALANAGLGAVHGFAGPVGGMFDAPHGAVCAALLPSVVLVNARALAEREPANPALRRYLEIAALVTGAAEARVADLCDWLNALRSALGIPGLVAYGIGEVDLDTLVAASAVASSIKANPITLTTVEMREILELAL